MMLRPKTWLAAARAAAGYSAPLLPFASFPAALTVEGQIRRPEELPHVSLIALSGIWRPLGGRQVLAMRTLNPVTVQSLTSAVAETIGPVPGGLVRAGMELEMEVFFNHSGIGAASRAYRSQIGNSTPIGDAVNTSFIGVLISNSGSDLAGVHKGRVFVKSDTNNPAHPVSPYGTGLSYAVGSPNRSMTVNFSLPWYIDIQMMSAAETAVNITSASWAAGVATYGTSAVHTLAVGDKTVIAGITPTGYNVAAGEIVLSVPTTTSFTVAMAADPGAYTSGGTSSRISNMISQSYVLELVG